MQRLTNQLKTMPVEMIVFVASLLAANATLLAGHACEALIFLPARVADGEWWRTVTFPWVHASLYHLLLDAGAFIFLYLGLHETSMLRRLGWVAGCAAGSLLAALFSCRLQGGLCGLSGIAHGLMAISGLELVKEQDDVLRKTGWICLGLILLKSLYECLAGHVLFSFLHLGSVGTPVAATHLGGVLGGCFVYLINHSIRKEEAHND